MFYEVFKKLCEDNGISTTKASQEIGFSKGNVSYWKKQYSLGKEAKPDSYTAEKIANFFGVSIDYLLGRTDDPIDYDSDGEALADIPLTYVQAANGDMKKARAIMLAAENDAQMDNANKANAVSEYIRKYNQLDDADQAKALAYIDGLLSADKYLTGLKAKNA